MRERSCLAHPHPHSDLVSSLPACAPAPALLAPAPLASDLSSTYQFITSYCQGSGTVSYSTTVSFACYFPFACPSSRPSFDVFPSCFYIPYSCPCRLWCVLVTLGLTRSSIESLNPKALPLPRKVGEIGYLLTYAAAFAKSGHGTGDVEDNLSMLSPPIPGFAFFFLFLGLTISPLYSCDCTFSSLWKYSGLVSHCSC